MHDDLSYGKYGKYGKYIVLVFLQSKYRVEFIQYLYIDLNSLCFFPVHIYCNAVTSKRYTVRLRDPKAFSLGKRFLSKKKNVTKILFRQYCTYHHHKYFPHCSESLFVSSFIFNKVWSIFNKVRFIFNKVRCQKITFYEQLNSVGVVSACGRRHSGSLQYIYKKSKINIF